MAKSTHSREYDDFRHLLRVVREEVDVTQVELATRLGWTQTMVSKAELGERRLDLVETTWWCDALGISIERFVERWVRA